MINDIASQLDDVYSPSEARELALWILEETTGLSRSTILACKDRQNILNLKNILHRLRKKEPIQYIFGHTLWAGLDLLVTPDTLIPRPETAELVDLVLKTMPQDEPLSVLDIGTGSGCIAIALKKQRPNWQVTAIDISPAALDIARQNALRNNVDITFLPADIFDPSLNFKPSTFNLITSNPPYVAESEKVSMKSNVLDYEPASALFVPDDDPLRFYRRIASLKIAPQLFFEINCRYGQQVTQLLRDYGYTDVQLYSDMYEKPRMVSARIEA